MEALENESPSQDFERKELSPIELLNEAVSALEIYESDPTQANKDRFHIGCTQLLTYKANNPEKSIRLVFRPVYYRVQSAYDKYIMNPLSQSDKL